jgi:hypothetical protein
MRSSILPGFLASGNGLSQSLTFLPEDRRLGERVDHEHVPIGSGNETLGTRLEHVHADGCSMVVVRILFACYQLSMYSSVKYKVKLSSGSTPVFSSNIGLKQGCKMSPSLFNVFINDIPELLNQIVIRCILKPPPFSHPPPLPLLMTGP